MSTKAGQAQFGRLQISDNGLLIEHMVAGREHSPHVAECDSCIAAALEIPFPGDQSEAAKFVTQSTVHLSENPETLLLELT